MHAGIRFRSRLEARWASFFDEIGWRWEYEPFDLEGYIPDFLILGDRPLLVEVGPVSLPAEFAAKSRKALGAIGDRELLTVGVNPLALIAGPNYSHPAAGLLSEPSAWDGVVEHATDLGLWHRCLDCGQIAIHHAEQSFIGRPCGHYDGDHLMGHIYESEIAGRWAIAVNNSQWRP